MTVSASTLKLADEEPNLTDVTPLQNPVPFTNTVFPPVVVPLFGTTLVTVGAVLPA
jgi:hypothetical protein